MIRFIIRVLVNGIAIALTALIAPGIKIVNPGILPYILLGLGFGLINAFIRPMLLLLTSRLIIFSLGWFILVINAAMLMLLGWLLPNQIQVAGFFPAVVGGIIMALIAMSLEAILGLAKPVGVELDDSSSGWYGFDRLPFGVGSRVVENMRIQEIYEAFWRYGTDIALENTAVGGFRRRVQSRIYDLPEERVELSVAAKVRILLQELGTTYVKMGQIVSSQAQSLPPEWLTELSKLQSNVPPFPSDIAREIVTKELGAPPEESFAQFERDPFAAASTAQVHRATLHNGQRVAVKVQRPDIMTQVRADLGILRDVASVLERRTEWAKNYNLYGTVNAFATNVIEELNYENEGLNARRLSHNLEAFSSVHIPTQYSNLTTSKVLTMEFVEGVKITDTAALDAAGMDREELAVTFISSMVKQLLFDGYFHADPHPGNILVNTETGKLIFLDMGMMGYLDSSQRLNLADLIFTIHMKNVGDLGRVMVGLSSVFKEFDENAFYRDLDRVTSRYMVFAEADDSFGDSMGVTLDMMQKHGLRLNSDLTLALKAMMQAEEAALALNPNIDIVSVAFNESRSLVVQQIDYDNIKGLVKQEAVRTVKEVVRRIPSLQEATIKWIDQYESGKLTLHIDTQDLANQVGQFSIATRYLTVGIILIGMLIGSALAANMPESQAWPFLADLAQPLFFLALLISGAIVGRIIWKLWWD